MPSKKKKIYGWSLEMAFFMTHVKFSCWKCIKFLNRKKWFDLLPHLCSQIIICNLSILGKSRQWNKNQFMANNGLFSRRRRMSRHPLQSAQRRTHQPNEVMIVTHPLENTTALWTSGATRWKRTCVKRLVKKFCGT